MQSAPVMRGAARAYQSPSVVQSCDWLQCAGKALNCAASCFPNPLSPGLHFLPGSAVGYLQKLLLATLLPAGPQERRALLVLRPCSF